MISAGRSFSGRERHCAYLDTGKPAGGDPLRFVNVSATTGLDLPDDGRGLALTDWDQDGDLDVWISNRTAPRLRFFATMYPIPIIQWRSVCKETATQ